MATKNEEYIAVAAVLISLVILSIFFGVFWSFLLVFTFLLLAYFSRRPQIKKKIITKKYKIKQELLDNSLDESEYLSNSSKEMDVPFTGLPSSKTQTLRSPMPLLSSLNTVTKRLSFNVSSLSSPDGQIYMVGNAGRRFNTTIGSPRQVTSPMSPIMSPQTPKYFSLINPTLQQPSTVKIATPEISNRTITLDEPKVSTDSPLSRATILSALKQSTIRKRSVIEDEDGTDDVSSPVENHKKKRRYQYPSGNESKKTKPMATAYTTDLEITRDIIPEPPVVTRKGAGIYSLIQTRLKRRPLHNDGNSTTEEGGVILKKTKKDYDKTAELAKVPESTESECQDRDVQMTGAIGNTESYDDDNDSGCDADDDDDIVMKTIPSSTGAARLSKKQAQKLEEQNREKRKRKEMKTTSTPSHTPRTSLSGTRTHTPDLPVSRQQRISKKQRLLNTPSVSEVTTSTNDSPASEKSDISGKEMSPKKRFTVIRFPSKKDESKRRPVPVYCASVNSPDLPKRHSVTHKITKEDIELDRKLAWQRVQSLLDGSDDDDEQEKFKGTNTSPSVAIRVTTCLPSPSRSMTSTVTTASGIPASSAQVVSSCKSNRSQDNAISTSQSTIIPSIGTTQPSTLLSSLAASKSSGTTTLTSVPTQSTMLLPGTLDTKGALATSSKAEPPSYQASLSSATQASVPHRFSLPSTSSTTGAIGQPPPAVGTPVNNLFAASAPNSSNTASLTSFTTSSQSIQAPLCTPVAQALLGTKTTNTTPGLPACTAPTSLSLNFGSTVSKPPQVVSNTSSNLPQMGFNMPSNLPQMGSGASSNLTGLSAPSNVSKTEGKSNLLQTGSSTPSILTGLSAPSNVSRTEGKSNLLQTGSSTPSILTGLSAPSNVSRTEGKSNLLQTGSSTPSILTGFSAPSNVSQTGYKSNLLQTGSSVSSNVPGFSGLSNLPQSGFNTASSLPKINFGATVPGGPTPSNVTTAATRSLFSGLNANTAESNLLNATKVTTQASQPGFASPGGFSFSASNAPKTTSQLSTFNFGGTQQTTAPTPFGSQAGPSVFGATPVTNRNASTAAPSNKNTFGSGLTSTTKSFGSATSSNVFGAPTSTSAPAFGVTSSSSQNTFGNTGASTTPGGFKFGANTATPSIFGNAAQPTTTTNAPNGQFSFSGGTSNASNVPQKKTGFSFTAGANSTSSSQSTFGAGASMSGFGAGATGTPFGAPSNQNVFGSAATTTPSGKNNQNAFGAPANQSTFGSPAPQNAFGNPASSSGAGGFSFSGGGGGSASAPSAGGFKFGAGASSGFQSTPSAAPSFGSTPSATPAASAGGFNFGASNTTSTPLFGAATPNTGGFKFGSGAQGPTSSVAKARPKATASRRRPRK